MSFLRSSPLFHRTFSSCSLLRKSLFKSYVDRISPNVKQVTTAHVDSKLTSFVKGKVQGKPTSFHLLDVREPYEWNESHISGATWVGRGFLEREIEALIPDINAEIICYCSAGNKSILAAETLKRMGYANVSSMEGGMGAWKDRGYFLVKNLRPQYDRHEAYDS